MPRSNQPARSAPPELLSIRSTLILLIAAFIGLVVGVLTALSGAGLAAAVLAGLPAAGASVLGLHILIER